MTAAVVRLCMDLRFRVRCVGCGRVMLAPPYVTAPKCERCHAS